MSGPVRAEATDPFTLLSVEGRYLPVLVSQQAKFEAAAGPMRTAMAQSLAQYLTMVGDHAGAAKVLNGAYPAAPARPAANFQGASVEDAVGAIVRAARGRRVVMLNESHTDGRCRAFAERVALALSREGFTVFAAEAFQQAAGSPIDDGAVNINDGYYLADPLFANLVRTASSAGYRMVTYEQRDDQEAPPGSAQSAVIEARETAQANNLMAALKASPEARAFVYCGPGHLSKLPSSRGDLWFAARFKAMSGIDPLTVDQSGGLPNADPTYDDPRTAGVTRSLRPKAPVVVHEADGQPLATEAGQRMGADLSVFHPGLPVRDGRPVWMRYGGRRAVQVSLKSAPADGVRLIQAIPIDELTKSRGVTPADQYLLSPGARAGSLWLKPGRYLTRVEITEGFHSLGEIRV